jgi:hypothetical protein
VGLVAADQPVLLAASVVMAVLVVVAAVLERVIQGLRH